jgi:hypothetical protein
MGLRGGNNTEFKQLKEPFVFLSADFKHSTMYIYRILNYFEYWDCEIVQRSPSTIQVIQLFVISFYNILSYFQQFNSINLLLFLEPDKYVIKNLH